MACPDRPLLPKISNVAVQALVEANVPITTLPDPCRTCDEPCDGVDGYAKLDIDMDSVMQGSFNGFGRMILCSAPGTMSSAAS
jgi:hypothetical protein